VSRFWSDLRAGAWRRWLPLRWGVSRTTVITLGPRDTESARSSDSSRRSSVESLRESLLMPPRFPRPRLEREAAAAAMGVDVAEYDRLESLQYRDITPEDYDTLRRLDSTVKPKTLASSVVIEQHAPRWRVIDHSDNSSDKGEASEPKSCCICMECFVEGDSVRTLPCKHDFHASCIDRWLLQCSECCPACSLAVVSA